ncbi:phosphoglucosamine mutase [Fodinicola acaciae]|uniref:phosphoglucosamine mutase n=1 Tax=Fodinicola acaciae TaxID=2681555 RepID=UPI0013D40A89|nr:phosphoglucosamine mutase [Fodinicola acaciae]
MARLFGTDGLRGLANGDLTPELATAVSVATAHVLATAAAGPRPVAVVGRDPRASGEMLEAAVCAGISAAGTDVLRVGVLPTPAIAHLVADTDADFGIVVSASHNPMPDNGIKVFARGGAKLADEIEDEIQTALEENASREWTRPVGSGIGRIRDLPDGRDRYLAYLAAAVPNRLDGLKVVVDCAHGASAGIAPRLYEQAGAEVIAIGNEPDGLNINDGVGATHLAPLRKAVVEHGADVGIAHDGDADRCLAVAADGSPVDGDAIMAILAVAMKEAGMLAGDTLVATVMSNLGLHLAMREHDIDVLTTAVGDRYVLEALRDKGLSLGGEQSGHVVLPAYAPTGDGLLTAVMLLARMAATKQSLAELAAVMTRLPQELVNVAVKDKAAAAASPDVAAAVHAAEDELGGRGRVLLRPSGTERLIRVMVEAATAGQAKTLADRIADVVKTAS